MAGETLLLAGNQIAQYTASNVTFPGGQTNIELQGVLTLGDSDSRFFLVRTSGDGDVIMNGQNFAVFAAVDDGTGNLVPGPTPIVSGNFATPDAFNDTGAGDDYIIFGLFGGSQFAVDLSGFDAQSTTSFVQGQDTLPGGDGELSVSEIEAANPDGPVICFVRGTLIQTPDGELPVEDLQVGTDICVSEGAPKKIVWIARRKIQLRQSNKRLSPIRIRRNAFGAGRPFQDLLVSPNHRIMHRSAFAQLWFEDETVLIPAKFMIDGKKVVPERNVTRVEYWHFLLDGHEVVRSNGILTESLHPGDVALSSMARASRSELLEIFPELSKVGVSGIKTKHRCLRRFEAQVLSNLGAFGRAPAQAMIY